MNTFGTLNGAIRHLPQHGYDQDFNLAADESILYAIGLGGGVRGLLVSAYSAYLPPPNDALLPEPTMPTA